jgi:DNA-binding protein H-NS
MSKSLEQLNAQIAKLQKEAQALMAKEVATVVAQIKALIAKHGLTAEDVGLGSGKAAEAPKKAARKAKAAPAKAAKAAATKAPKAAKRAAKAPKATKAAKPAKGAKGAKAGKSTLTAGVIKYRDEAGNSWTGRGKRPQWYLAALASGKTAEQLLAS